jgi:hypothetical protein
MVGESVSPDALGAMYLPPHTIVTVKRSNKNRS